MNVEFYYRRSYSIFRKIRAAQINKYSKKINVAINEIPVPKPEDNEILVKVKVAAFNPLEILQITGA